MTTISTPPRDPPQDLATVPFAAVAAMDRDAFVRQFGGVFAAGAWVAEAAWRARPFATLESLHEAMVSVVLLAPRARRLELIRAHTASGILAAARTRIACDAGAEERMALDEVTKIAHRRLWELVE